MQRIVHILEINTSPRQIFLALTLPDKLSQWWTTDVKADVTKGMLNFRFHDDFNPDMRIEQQEPDEEVRWQCLSGHEQWHESTVTFGLEGNEQSTQLTFAQNFADKVSEAAYGRYNFNWGYYLDSLRLFCETGRGKPFQAQP